MGGHFVDFLRAEQPAAEIFGLIKPQGGPAARLPASTIEADLEDAPSVEAAFDQVQPDRIVHLAAQSSVQQSWSDPGGTLRTNVHGLLNVLEALRRRSLWPRILVVGSAEEYGLVEAKDLPLREDAPLRPNSPYAVSKLAQGFLALQYTLSLKLATLRTRTFHHTGRGRGELFAESSFARQIAEIEAGCRPSVLEVGNLDAVRDFSDVRDVVRAYWALLDRGVPGEVYNVCSGKGVRIRDLLQRLIEISGLDVEVRVDPERLRPSDVPVLIGDPGKLREATGWIPRHGLDETLRGLLDYWRERVGGAAREVGR